MAISPGRPLEDELDELRTRAGDLESLGRAARALARSTGAESVGRIVCEAASDVASADVVALLELSVDGTALMVGCSSEADLDGATMQLTQSSLAGAAFRDGERVYEDDLMPHGTAAWPLRQCGARSAVWQPVGGERGVRAVIALGWRRPMRQTDRLRAALELLAGEAEVALDRAAALERLTVLARTDPLTDLSNRRAWQDELARELSRADRGGERLSIGLIDLDEFKEFNDRWGHVGGRSPAAHRGRPLAPPAAHLRPARPDRRRRVRDHPSRLRRSQQAVGARRPAARRAPRRALLLDRRRRVGPGRARRGASRPGGPGAVRGQGRRAKPDGRRAGAHRDANLDPLP